MVNLDMVRMCGWTLGSANTKDKALEPKGLPPPSPARVYNPLLM